jgi:hypothetical protein
MKPDFGLGIGGFSNIRKYRELSNQKPVRLK